MGFLIFLVELVAFLLALLVLVAAVWLGWVGFWLLVGILASLERVGDWIGKRLNRYLGV